MLDSFIVSCNTTYATGRPRPRRDVRDGHPELRRADRAAAPETARASTRRSCASTGPEPGHVPAQPAEVHAGRDRPEPGARSRRCEMALVAEAIANQGVDPATARRRLRARPERQGRLPGRRAAVQAGDRPRHRGHDAHVHARRRERPARAPAPRPRSPASRSRARPAPPRPHQGEKPHAWFIAFAPADAPEYAIAVLVEHGGSDATPRRPVGGSPRRSRSRCSRRC